MSVNSTMADRACKRPPEDYTKGSKVERLGRFLAKRDTRWLMGNVIMRISSNKGPVPLPSGDDEYISVLHQSATSITIHNLKKDPIF